MQAPPQTLVPGPQQSALAVMQALPHAWGCVDGQHLPVPVQTLPAEQNPPSPSQQSAPDGTQPPSQATVLPVQVPIGVHALVS